MAKRAKTAEKPKPEGLDPKIIAFHASQIDQAKERLNTANGEYRAVVKKAKAAGCKTSVLLEVLREKKQDLDQVNIDLKDKLYYRDILGMPVDQKYLFGSPKVSAEVREQVTIQDAEAAGFIAGKSGADRGDNRHPAGSAMFAAWDRGYLKGQEVIAKQMGPKGTVASTRKARQAAAPRLPLGSAPAGKPNGKPAGKTGGKPRGKAGAAGGPVQHGASTEAAATTLN